MKSQHLYQQRTFEYHLVTILSLQFITLLAILYLRGASHVRYFPSSTADRTPAPHYCSRAMQATWEQWFVIGSQHQFHAYFVAV
jgi:hypothetical protein